MGMRGVHFALSKDQESRLLKANDDDAVMKVVEDVEKAWDEPHVQETDKAWNAIHRCLTDGRLAYDNGTYPLNRCILGGRQLYESDDYIVAFVTANEVHDVAEVLATIDQHQFRKRYFGINPDDYNGRLSDEDFDYTWGWFEDLKGFYRRAATDNRSVIFTVDQ